MPLHRSPLVREIEKKTGERIYDVLHRLRFERVLTIKQMAQELTELIDKPVPEGSLSVWLSELGLAYRQVREQQRREVAG